MIIRAPDWRQTPNNMKKLIIANWKMQLTINASQELAKKFARAIKTNKYEVVVCPDYLSLAAVSAALKKSRLKLGAQDSAIASQGAYTGEVSPFNLKSLGVQYVILGHSERREHLHENSAIINNKIKAALQNKIIPILCLGEKWEERAAGQTKDFLNMELRHALKGVKIKNASDLVIAYEPVWAISTNKNAQPMRPEEADKIQKFLRDRATKILKKSVRVIYGGSADSRNTAFFLSRPNVDGLLVGGASLRAEEFIKMTS